MGTKNRFTNEYKQEIVKLVAELGKKPTEVAEDIKGHCYHCQKVGKAI